MLIVLQNIRLLDLNKPPTSAARVHHIDLQDFEKNAQSLRKGLTYIKKT